jgi:hypothetical protein
MLPELRSCIASSACVGAYPAEGRAVAGRRTALEWTKRRWRCRTPDRARSTFTESVPQIPSRHRLTARLRESAGRAVADGARSVIQRMPDAASHVIDTGLNMTGEVPGRLHGWFPTVKSAPVRR